ncbi:unnamed protein product [Coffea canephora]|uniref:DH200=94 genomic scaffold, scaffold_4871 n=1 Tax=Coffea canephora TaxID=49390 RepID=A0A068VPD0_COFCA|nr:unnamed protein product [Coffea canephora]
MRSFFQEIQNIEYYCGFHVYMNCKMHDIVHDFAQFLTKNECHALGGIGRNSSSERARHLIILECTEEEMFSSRVVDFGRLRSVLTFPEIGRVVLQNLFYRLKCVRTLALCNCELAEIPAEIGSLIHLRHLDLSFNPFVTLPEAICDLYYLETFDIRLRKLTSLCSLTWFILRSNYDDLAILKDLDQLERLDVDIEGEVDFGIAKLGKKIYMCEMSLFFSFGAHFIETPSCIESMEPPPNLEQLALIGCPGTQLPSWLVMKSHTNNLTKLIISKACNISSLLALWKLSSLDELRLMGVDKLECLGKEFFGSSSSSEAVAFLNLRKLRFSCFKNWTNWEDLSEDDEEIAVSVMPRLEKLEIQDCEKLEILPHHILRKISSLKNLEIICCDKLRDRYSDKTRDDWIKISHISLVHISDE